MLSLHLIATPLSFAFIPILYLLYFIFRIKVGLIFSERIGHLSLNIETFMRKKQMGYSKGVRYIFISRSPANRQLLKMWKRHLFIIENDILYKIFKYISQKAKRLRVIETIEMLSNEYKIFNLGKPVLYFTEAEEVRGRVGLHKYGIKRKDDWFVCVFARDPIYLNKVYPNGKWAYHDFRNADIDTFIPAIKYIIEKGGYVFRMGYEVNKSVEFKHKNFIDYAVDSRDDFMDIYLTAKCRFLLGTTSGICDVAMIFDSPRIGTNWVPPGNAPWGKNCLCLPKKIKEKKSGRYVSLKNFIHATKDRNNQLLWNGNIFDKAGYEYEDNTEEEILEVTKEMISRLENRWNPDEKEQKLLEKYFQAFPKDHWAYEIKTPIGLAFLKKYEELF